MQLTTPVEIATPVFKINPADRLLFVGSCFAAEIGSRFEANRFNATVNPFGTMYNPASIMHTVERSTAPDVAILTLGTNHVYILKETDEIVDNCQKRPANLFREQELSVQQCADYLSKTVECLRCGNPECKVIVTVSPIRYQKYGFHNSRLSKATLLLAAEELVRSTDDTAYFPAYEIMNDELRDYRFYKTDMLHPSTQAADYIHERFCETFLSTEAMQMQKEWQPIKHGLAHRPFNPDSEEYRRFISQIKEKEQQFIDKWKL